MQQDYFVLVIDLRTLAGLQGVSFFVFFLLLCANSSCLWVWGLFFVVAVVVVVVVLTFIR